MSRHVYALLAAHDGCTKYCFQTLFLFLLTIVLSSFLTNLCLYSAKRMHLHALEVQEVFVAIRPISDSLNTKKVFPSRRCFELLNSTSTFKLLFDINLNCLNCKTIRQSLTEFQSFLDGLVAGQKRIELLGPNNIFCCYPYLIYILV